MFDRVARSRSLRNVNRRRAGHRAANRHRPALDALEARALLATFTVSSAADSGPDTLRQAITDANALPGADVIVFARALRGGTITLSSPINIQDDLTLDGPGADRLTISGGGTSGLLTVAPLPVLEIYYGDLPAVELTIEDLTLADGNASGFDFPASGRGGALYAYRAEVTVEDTVWRGNRATGGGAIYVEAGQIYDEDFNFLGIVPGALTVRDSRFESNQADSGGAAWALGSPVTIRGSQFVGNTADGFFVQGGAVGVAGTTSLDVAESRFEGNRALGVGRAEGGAILATGVESLRVVASEFVANRAESPGNSQIGGGVGLGGAIRADGLTSFAVSESRFEGNRVAGSILASGGALDTSMVFDSEGLAIDDSRFLDNEAVGLPLYFGASIFGVPAAMGGAIHNGGSLDVSSSRFEGNRAVGADNQFDNGGAGLGGAIANEIGPRLSLRDSRFDDNEVRGGRGGTGSFSTLSGFVRGGAVYSLFTSATIEDSRFTGNAAIGGGATRPGSPGGVAQGGAVALAGGDAQVLTDVKFADNRARGGDGGPSDPDQGIEGGTAGDGQGGGLFLEETTATLTDGRFSANEARGGDSPGGPAGDGRGGALFSSGALTIRDAHLAGNRAFGGLSATGGDALGGGLYAAGSILAYDLKVTGNQAIAGPAGQGFGGGIYLAPGTAAILRRTRATGNKATTAGDQIYGTYST